LEWKYFFDGDEKDCQVVPLRNDENGIEGQAFKKD